MKNQPTPTDCKMPCFIHPIKPIMGLKPIMGIVALTLALPAMAVDRSEASKEAQQAPNNQPVEAAVAAREDAAPKEGKKKAEKQQPMIGLGGAPASKTLSLHLGLPEGSGLTLFHVIPDSAAAKAGIKEHDVLTTFDGKPIGSQQDLRDAITPHQPGDEVLINYIHEGKAVEKKVTLGLRPAHLGKMHAPGMNKRWMFKGLGAEVPEADRKRIEELMKKRGEDFQKQLQKQGVLEFEVQIPGGPMLKNGGPPAGGFQMNASTSMTMSDPEGSVTMKTVNGKKEVIVRDKKGEVVFEGPYDTAQDKAALPDDLSERVEKLGSTKIGAKAFRVEVGPGGKFNPPVPDEDEDAE